MWWRHAGKAALGFLIWAAFAIEHVGADACNGEEDTCSYSETFCCFQGKFLPLFGEFERKLPNIIRLILYLSGLIFTFLGIGIISDIFMTGIEKVTSKKARVADKKNPGKFRTVYVWNATVANLTLMALGSSAPEILLSLIEITTDDMFLGDLGAGTIVGSAAFNLLCISAVCVLAIEDGEVRTIDQTKVYIVTAFFSVFAYLWLMFILMVTSPDVCTIWEAVVTLLFCPLFVFLAYLADRGYFDFNSKTYEEQTDAPAIQALDLSEISHEDLKQLEHTIRENHGKHLTDEMVAEIMRLQYLPKRSRAYYRHMTTQKATNGKKAPEFSCSSSLGHGRVSDTANTFDDIDQEKKNLIAFIEFALKTYAVVENCGVAKIVVVRKGCVSVKASCNFATREGTAKAGEDYDHKEGLIVFERNEVEKTIEVPIKDDDSVEHNEWFHIDLASPHCEDGSSYEAKLGETKCATVVIIDDDEPGKIRFKEESVDIKEDNKSEKLTITVERYQGCKGEISCKWHTEEHSGKDGIDFVHQEGTITFQNDELAHTVTVTILPRSRVGDYTFFVMLKDPSDNTGFDENRDGGKDSNICTVTFKGTESKGDALTKMKDTVMTMNNVMGHKKWGEQFQSAIFEVGDEEDEDPPSNFDYFMHVVTIPWKLLFAFVPPPNYCEGWACFCGALCMIAVVTALVGDLANLVGCCLGIKPEITAITFVALGTSLPDTFASKAAALMEEHADASIGNITGSNSVNVFMGIGLSWCIAAFYWQTGEPSPEWFCKLALYDNDVQKNVLDAAGCTLQAGGGYKCDSAVFMSPAGSIWFNLMVFSVNAMLAIAVLAERRKLYGGELGGPKCWSKFLGQYQTAAFLVGQWCIYIAASSVYATVVGEKSEQDFGKFLFN